MVLPADAPVGTYSINVTGIEADNVTYYLSQSFTVPSNVNITPNHIGGGLPGTNVSYNHTVTNTGFGRDLYEFSVSSILGWNVTIYYDSNGDGTLDGGDVWMGTDTGGDGTWNSVNPSYDRNNDGSPDTGLLLRGQTFRIIVEIEIPNGTGTVTEVTTTTVDSIYSTASDSATIVVVVPEFETVIIPVVILMIIIILIRNKRKRNNK
jgi:hypothetical protein